LETKNKFFDAIGTPTIWSSAAWRNFTQSVCHSPPHKIPSPDTPTGIGLRPGVAGGSETAAVAGRDEEAQQKLAGAAKQAGFVQPLHFSHFHGSRVVADARSAKVSAHHFFADRPSAAQSARLRLADPKNVVLNFSQKPGFNLEKIRSFSI
jgi:hypothetical protein